MKTGMQRSYETMPIINHVVIPLAVTLARSRAEVIAELRSSDIHCPPPTFGIVRLIRVGLLLGAIGRGNLPGASFYTFRV